MRFVPIARLIAVALLVRALPATAGPLELDLTSALERARRVAPDAVAARAQIAIAQAEVAGASVVFRDNPDIEAGVGPRLTASRAVDVDIRIEQNLDPWRRAPRRALARAGVAQAKAEVDASLRLLDLQVATAFYEALHADRAVELARRAEDLAQKALETAERRRKAGDITDLDLGLARGALGRARSATQATTADRTIAIGTLAALVGASPDDTIVLRGDLKPIAFSDPAVLKASLANRSEVRVYEAQREAAIAEGDQARANGRLQLGLWAGYRREDTDSIIAGGLRFTLPVWNRAQGDKAAAVAKARGATDTRDVVLRVADRQLADALAAYASTKAAVDTFEKDVLPSIDESELLLQKTVDAGQLAISSYLIARQEILTGRREYLDRLLALAKASVAVRFASGGAP